MLSPFHSIFSGLGLSQDEFQSELNLTRGRRRRIQTSGTVYRTAATVKHCAIVERRRKIGVVENIEKLCAKLDVGTLRDGLYFRILYQGKIKIRQPGSNQGISLQMAAQV